MKHRHEVDAELEYLESLAGVVAVTIEDLVRVVDVYMRGQLSQEALDAILYPVLGELIVVVQAAATRRETAPGNRRLGETRLDDAVFALTVKLASDSVN